jgi:hypothetical protein
MKLGKSLEIFVLRGEYKFRLVSKIEDIQKGRVCVTLITAKTHVFQFYHTDRISFVYKDENRLWNWSDVIGGTTELDGYQLHCFYTDKEGESYNRRNSYRVFIGEDIKLHYYITASNKVAKVSGFEEEDKNIEQKSEGKEMKEMVCDGFIKDLSENGAGIFSDERFSLKDEISFTIYSDFGSFICKAEIVRVSQENHGIYKRFYGCYFTESDRRLIKHLFKLQRQALQNNR